MSEIYIRRCLLYEFQQGHSASKAKRNICAYIHPRAVSLSTAIYWFKRFKQGDFNLTNSPHPYLIPKVQIERLRELVKADNTRTMRSLAAELRISHSTVKRYLNDLGIEFNGKVWISSTEVKKDSIRSAQNIRHTLPSIESFSIDTTSKSSIADEWLQASTPQY